MVSESHRPDMQRPSIEAELRLVMREREEREALRRFGRGRRRRAPRTDGPRNVASSTGLTGFEL
jgi:hypothetical protein